MAVHPCRAKQDTFGNPTFKMHNCAAGSEKTTCGLDAFEVNVTAGYTSMCRTCWPQKREKAWDDENPDNQGDVISGREEE